MDVPSTPGLHEVLRDTQPRVGLHRGRAYAGNELDALGEISVSRSSQVNSIRVVVGLSDTTPPTRDARSG